MLKQFTAIYILVVCLFVGPTTIHAQSSNRFEIKIPFAFGLEGRTLPPGKYVVERTDQGRPNIFTLESVDKGTVRIVMTQRVENDKPTEGASLVFIRREGKFYLFQVWNTGAMNGGQIPLSEKPGRDQQSKGPTFVTLRAKVK